MAVAVIAAAVLIPARGLLRQTDVAAADARPEAETQPGQVAAAARPEMKKTVATKVSPTPVPTNTRATDPLTGKGPAAESAAKAPAAERAAKADVQQSATVTITGCVELDEETFWLKDTAGVDAPTSRSWRSGFLKKRSSPIELVDAGKTLKLGNYVGQRVVATGVIVNREMRARSLQRVVAPCSKNPKA